MNLSLEWASWRTILRSKFALRHGYHPLEENESENLRTFELRPAPFLFKEDIQRKDMCHTVLEVNRVNVFFKPVHPKPNQPDPPESRFCYAQPDSNLLDSNPAGQFWMPKPTGQF